MIMPVDGWSDSKNMVRTGIYSEHFKLIVIVNEKWINIR